MMTFKQFLNEVIEKDGSEYVVKTEDRSRVLGKHKTKKEAQAQLAAIEISKHKAGK